MPKESLYKLCDKLRIYLEKQKTQFRDPISVEIILLFEIC